MAKVRRADFAEFKLYAGETPEGYLRGYALGTKVGVFPYQDAKGEVHYEYRPAEELFRAETLDSMKGIPVTLDHPNEGLVTAENADRLMRGFTGADVRPDGDRIYTDLTITHKAAIEAVRGGTRQQLSYGYEVELVAKAGDYQGQKYDFVQTAIRYNHLALVEQARMGPEARVNVDAGAAGVPVLRLDGGGNQILPIIDNTIMTDQTVCPTKEVRAMVKVTIDEIQYDAAPEVAKALEKAQAGAVVDKARLEGLKEVTLDGGVKVLGDPKLAEALAKALGERDGLKAKLDEAAKSQDALIQAAATTRLRILDAGRKVLNQDAVARLEGMSNLDIQKAVLVECAPEGRRDELKKLLEGKEAAYVGARFDQVVETLPAGPGGLAVMDPPIKDPKADEKDPEKARAKADQEAADAYKPKK